MLLPLLHLSPGWGSPQGPAPLHPPRPLLPGASLSHLLGNLPACAGT